MARDILAELKPVFYPRGVAIVGVSRHPRKFSHGWFKGFLAAGFPGGLYAVNRSGGEILGRRMYRSLIDIPGPVDLVIVCIPREAVMALMDDCIVKGVKVVQFFTGGFRETGREEDAALEEALLEKARGAGVRIIGPNCVGIYNPEAHIPQGPAGLIGVPGTVGFISQSGGHAGKLAEIGLSNGIAFSKMVSYGNAADLGAADFIEYLGADLCTDVIGGYVEGARDA
ncbi:MAG: CoA-binding protein, partial [Chloroflexi bacterium]|nr:CoA-binding protein [Chloroflexota bacterium]